MSLSGEKLLRRLADGQVHSGTALAAEFGVTRAAIWKCIQQLQALGVEISAGAGRGYQLVQPLELLDANAIIAALPAAVREYSDAIEVHWTTTSTNDLLLQLPAVQPGRSRACFAEFQTGGRGRRGRKWLAPAGGGICLSLSWSFRTSPPQLGCLGLVAGVGVLRAVRAAGADVAQLKWPNDVVVAGRKLAGILIDVKGEASGPLQVVIGVGLNYDLPQAATQEIIAAGGLQPAALSACGGVTGRNAVASALVAHLHDVMTEFANNGFSALADDWRAADYLHGREVEVTTDGERLAGVVRGIAADGRLQLATAAGIIHLTTGDVSVRLAA